MQKTLENMSKFITADDAGPTHDRHKELIRIYRQKDHPLHIRRTLDQFYYYMLNNTSDRDKGQVVSRYVKRTFGDPSLVMMVDQLWLWVLDGGIGDFPKTG
jgi:vacuolar-type H+-ATPase subunit C/Vma6